MSETSMRGVRIGDMTEAKLFQMPQPLESRRINDTALKFRQTNGTMNRIYDDSINFKPL